MEGVVVIRLIRVCFVPTSEKVGRRLLPPFESVMATVGRKGFLTFAVSVWEERSEFRIFRLFPSGLFKSWTHLHW